VAQEAKVFLNGLPNQIEAWRDFKSVQLVNLDRLKSTERFTLTPNQRRTLLEIVDKDDLDNSNYAKAILQLVEGMRFEPRTEGFSGTNVGVSALTMKVMPSTKSESISITPNPAKEQVNFTVPANFKVNRIDIYGINGHLYRSIRVENERITTDTNGMSGGMYIVKFMDEQGISKQITKLFINK
jgi:Secretion system C-terminal sorting domain